MSMSITSSRAGDAAARNGSARGHGDQRPSTSRRFLFGAPAPGGFVSAACRKNARNGYSRFSWSRARAARDDLREELEATRGGHDPRGDIRSSVITARRGRAQRRRRPASPPAPPRAAPAGGRWPALQAVLQHEQRRVHDRSQGAAFGSSVFPTPRALDSTDRRRDRFRFRFFGAPLGAETSVRRRRRAAAHLTGSPTRRALHRLASRSISARRFLGPFFAYPFSRVRIARAARRRRRPARVRGGGRNRDAAAAAPPVRSRRRSPRAPCASTSRRTRSRSRRSRSAPARARAPRWLAAARRASSARVAARPGSGFLLASGRFGPFGEPAPIRRRRRATAEAACAPPSRPQGPLWRAFAPSPTARREKRTPKRTPDPRANSSSRRGSPRRRARRGGTTRPAARR